jgi:hypothetical protein
MAKKNEKKSIHIRVTNDEYDRMQDISKKAGFATVSSYLRVVGLNSKINSAIEIGRKGR